MGAHTVITHALNLGGGVSTAKITDAPSRDVILVWDLSETMIVPVLLVEGGPVADCPWCEPGVAAWYVAGEDHVCGHHALVYGRFVAESSL